MGLVRLELLAGAANRLRQSDVPAERPAAADNGELAAINVERPCSGSESVSPPTIR